MILEKMSCLKNSSCFPLNFSCILKAKLKSLSLPISLLPLFKKLDSSLLIHQAVLIYQRPYFMCFLLSPYILITIWNQFSGKSLSQLILRKWTGSFWLYSAPWLPNCTRPAGRCFWSKQQLMLLYGRMNYCLLALNRQ